MLERVRAFVTDKKRLSHITGGLGNILARAESAGLFEKAPAFIRDYHKDYPGLAELEAAHADVKRECIELLALRDRMIDVENIAGKYTAGGIHAIQWKAYMFKSFRFIDENCARAPRTAALLRNVPGLYTAFFSILDPHQYITPHWGYWKGFLRYHLGVVVPRNNEDKACWLRVNPSPEDNARHDTKLIAQGEKYYWREGAGVMFDDTYLHDAANDSDEVRVVLWLDMRRRMPPALHALNTAVLEIAHRTPAIARVRKNAVLKVG